ncbi:MAG: SGNH/GDSL hydrolase family protein [Flavobacteriales bacterium]|nr:SGNH/GDSL hydrolase family protein [Flavobacteriales bacterium]
MRFSGYTPGQFSYSQWITHVDELQSIEGFKADSLGIFKVDTAVSNHLFSTLSNTGFKILNLLRNRLGRNYVPEVTSIFENHLDLINGEVENEFSEFYSNISDNVKNGPFDSLIYTYIKSPINSDGFYSIPFSYSDSERKKILLLGDSFTWGHSAPSKTGSFANTLLSRGYLVYNSGISGADVAQYKRVLETYLPIIRPDVVVVNFFLGNDISHFEREPRSGVPIHYSTNAGNILSFQGGQYFNDPQSAYNNVLGNMRIPQTSTLNKWSAKTVITTYLWAAATKFGFTQHRFFYGKKQPEIPSCNAEIAYMAQLCKESGVKFIVSVIPSLENGKLKRVEDFPHLFTNMEYHEPDMTLDLYNTNDGHFNAEGHTVYADYLEQLILDRP